MDPEIIIGQLGALTRREAEAVLWVAMGKTSWEAGRILGVTEHTVSAHVASAAEKLRASNRAHLVARAFVQGVLLAAAKAVPALLLTALCGLATIGDGPARVPRSASARGRR